MNSRPSPTLPDLGATLREFSAARTLPAAVYTDAWVHALEQEQIFSRMWLNVCRSADLASPGDFITRQLGKEKILLTRDKSGQINAFYNVCRHRGTRLVEETQGSNRLRISCPYHGWTYAADGELIKAPHMDGGFCAAEHALLKVRIDVFAGFVFVNLDRDAEPLHAWLADLPDLSRYRLDTLITGHSASYLVDANWKFIIENYSECYHCALNHPQLNRITDYRSGGKSVSGRCYNGGPMTLNDGFTSLSMSGQSTLPVIPGLPEQDHKEINYYCIYPNFLLSPHSDYVLVHKLWPLSAQQTEVTCEWLFTPDAVAMQGFDPGDMVEFWDVTNRQDWELCERAQKGAGSSGFSPGPYSDMEECIYLFDYWYASRLQEAANPLPADS